MNAITPQKPSHDLNDDLSDLIGSPLREKPATLPEGFKPAEERIFTEPCQKCRGSGMWHGGHSSGPCFKCKGTGRHTFKTAPDKRASARASSHKRKADKAQERAAEITQQMEAFKIAEPVIWAWMDGSTFPFAVSMRQALAQWGSLTENQLAACRRIIGKRDAARTAATERQANAPTVDMSKLTEAFAKASAALKWPKLRMPGGLSFTRAASTAKYPGAIYVRGLAADKSEEVYFGRIDGGRFIGTRACNAEQEAKVLEAAADPKGQAVAYGRLTGACSCCGVSFLIPIALPPASARSAQPSLVSREATNAPDVLPALPSQHRHIRQKAASALL